MILTGKSQYGLPDSFEVSNTSVGFFGVTRCGKTTQELKLFEAAKKDRNCLNIVFGRVRRTFLRIRRQGDIASPNESPYGTLEFYA